MVQFDVFWSVFCYNFVEKNIVKIFIFIEIKDIVLLSTIFRGTLEHTSQNVCLLCNLVRFGLHFLRTFSEANTYEYLSSIFFANFSACGRPFLGPPPPEQNFLRAHEYMMVLLRTIDQGIPGNIGLRYGSVVQTTSESSADRLKVDRTAESNRIHIFGNDFDHGRRIQILQIFNPFFDTTFLLKS